MVGLGVKPGGSRLDRGPTGDKNGGFFLLPAFLIIRMGKTKLQFREEFPVIWRKPETGMDGVRAHKWRECV